MDSTVNSSDSGTREEAPLHPPLLFILHVEARGLDTDVWVNGVPVFREAWGRPRNFETKVNMYVRQGTNDVRLSVRPLRDGEGRFRRDERALTVQMQRGHLGSDIPADGVLLGYPDVEGSEPMRGAWALTRVWHGSFEVTDPIGALLWDGNDPAPPTMADRDDIAGMLARLHFALVSRDLDALVTLLAFRRDEMCRALGIARSKWDGWEREEMSEFLDSPAWRMDPFDDAGLVLHPYCDGRLIGVTDREGRAPLRGSAGVETYALSPMFAKVDGYWEIVR